MATDKNDKFKKIVSEQFTVSKKKGGGIIKIDAWENSKREIVKYSMAYINHLIYPNDNGRVLGYDNTHNSHHKHYLGEISEVSNFKGYQDLLERFEKEVRRFIK